ncbi:MAG TPA: RDD family protein, partial [Pyrinomonadaceae bacterium]|nr:RDD family protein [Pyrinomonadaceae bacterium]
RDSQGASLGKSLFGMRVIGKDGREATTGARVLRNLLFAIPAFIMIVPILGHILGSFLAFIIVITELVSLLASGERLGDKLANTVVIKTK